MFDELGLHRATARSRPPPRRADRPLRCANETGFSARTSLALVLMESSATLVLVVIQPRLRARWLLRMVNIEAASRRRGSSPSSASKIFFSGKIQTALFDFRRGVHWLRTEPKAGGAKPDATPNSIITLETFTPWRPSSVDDHVGIRCFTSYGKLWAGRESRSQSWVAQLLLELRNAAASCKEERTLKRSLYVLLSIKPPPRRGLTRAGLSPLSLALRCARARSANDDPWRRWTPRDTSVRSP